MNKSYGRLGYLAAASAAFGLMGCNPPSEAYRAPGKLTVNDCVPAGIELGTSVPAEALVVTTTKRGRMRVSVIVVQALDEQGQGVTDSVAQATARRTKRYEFETTSADQAGTMVTAVVMTEKNRPASGDRCSDTVSVARATRECPSDAASETPCTSFVEVQVYSNQDPATTREPISSFKTRRTRHPRTESPFAVQVPRWKN